MHMGDLPRQPTRQQLEAARRHLQADRPRPVADEPPAPRRPAAPPAPPPPPAVPRYVDDFVCLLPPAPPGLWRRLVNWLSGPR